MKKEKAPVFESEAAMCADFIGYLKRCHGKWTVYPETAGWDILLVRKEDGCQVGIEAKLVLNQQVVEQACDDLMGWRVGTTGPDFRAVLVPKTRENSVFPFFCKLLGINILVWEPIKKNTWVGIELPGRMTEANGYPYFTGLASWTPQLPDTRHPLPEYVPDVTAGASAPVQLSHWKIQALKLQCILETRPVRRADFEVLKLSPSRWTQGWLQRSPQGWIRGKSMPDFAARHPAIYEQIKADREKWMPKDLATAFKLEPTK